MKADLQMPDNSTENNIRLLWENYKEIFKNRTRIEL